MGDKQVKAKYSRQTTLNTDDNISLSHFEFVGKLGKGAFGTVHLAQHKRDKKLFALKEVST